MLSSLLQSAKISACASAGSAVDSEGPLTWLCNYFFANESTFYNASLHCSVDKQAKTLLQQLISSVLLFYDFVILSQWIACVRMYVCGGYVDGQATASIKFFWKVSSSIFLAVFFTALDAVTAKRCTTFLVSMVVFGTLRFSKSQAKKEAKISRRFAYVET